MSVGERSGQRMTIGDLAALTAPVSEADPCGSDLDLSGDPEYMNYMARGEGLLPATFYSGPDGQPFDRTAIDFAAEFEGAKPFLAQTRDLRLLALLAKLFVLNRDLGGFVTCVQAIAALIENQWDGVHPRGESGDFGMRLAAIETLFLIPVFLVTFFLQDHLLRGVTFGTVKK